MNKSRLEAVVDDLRLKCAAADATEDAGMVAQVSERACRMCSAVPVSVLRELFPEVRFR